MTASPPRLLVFDLDGTLVDSLPDIAASLNAMLGARSLPPLAREQVGPMTGDGLEKLIARAFAAYGRAPDPAAGAEYLSRYEARVAAETRLFPGVEDALQQLRNRGWRMAVCTNKPEAAAHALLAELGIDGLFASVGGGDTFPVRKPDPQHLRLTIAAAEGDPGLAVMTGDHANDVAAGRGIGAPVIFAAWGYGLPGMERGATVIARTASDLPELAELLLPG